MSRMFARKSKVKNATALYTDSLVTQLEEQQQESNSILYHIRLSVDSQARSGTTSDYFNASARTVKSLNIQLKEPEKLVLVPWSVYECTTNHSTGRYNQSNLALLVDLPSRDTLDNFATFPIWIAPPATQFIDFLSNGSG